MTVKIAYDNDPGVQNWVVNKIGSSGFLLNKIDKQSTHNNQSAAKRAARRMASDGERIVLTRRNGSTDTLRKGS